MRKLTVLLPLLAIIGAGAYAVQVLGSETELFKLYPNHDPKVLAKVHRKLCSDLALGKYNHLNINNDEDAAQLFEKKLAEYYANK